MFAKIQNKKNRRPVIIQELYIEVWLVPTLSEEQIKEVVNNDLVDEELETWPMSKDLYRGEVGQRPNITEKVKYKELEISYN